MGPFKKTLFLTTNMINTKITINGKILDETNDDDLSWIPEHHKNTIKDKDFKSLECITKLGNSILKIQITKL